MNFYPYSSPIILTDAIFQSYGGDVANSTPSVREAAYLMAEEAVSRDLNTFLLPTIVTGTYFYAPHIILEHAYVHQIYEVRFRNSKGEVYWTVSGTFNDYTRLYSEVYGVLDLDYLSAGNPSCRGLAYPYQVDVVYQAGLPTGTAFSSVVLTALTKVASMFINEIQGWGNEAVGNIGIVEFRNQQYAEVRTKLVDTVYGNSAVAQFVHKLLGGLRKYRWVGM